MHDTREGWLHGAADAIALELQARTGHTMPRVRITCGFPSNGWVSRKRTIGRVIGECWPPQLSTDKTYHQISITPLLGNATDVLAVLVHEIIHATVGCDAGHSKVFKDVAVEMGLGGKMTATVPTDEGAEWLAAMGAWLGPFPHAALDPWNSKGGGDTPKPGDPEAPWSPDTPRKQPARLLKVECQSCGYVARVTKKWLESTGAPICPCNMLPMAMK